MFCVTDSTVKLQINVKVCGDLKQKFKEVMIWTMDGSWWQVHALIILRPGKSHLWIGGWMSSGADVNVGKR
jgi:hypothetical protein